MRVFLDFLLFVLTMALVTLIGVLIILGWSMSLGWLLQLIFPLLSWFEASLLVMVPSLVTAYALSRMTMTLPGARLSMDNEDEDELPIPMERVLLDGVKLTNESWFHYQLANSIFAAIHGDEDVVGVLTTAQVEAMALQLAEHMLALLKRRRKNAPRLTLTVRALKEEIQREGLQPEEDDILQTAVAAANLTLTVDETLADIVRQKSWRKRRWF